MDIDRKCLNLAKVYLSDFAYPTDEAKKAAQERLAKTIEDAANEWIEAHCDF